MGARSGGRRERSRIFGQGLKFFNVFGPNEFHKGRMASVVFHTFNQVNATGAMKLCSGPTARIMLTEAKPGISSTSRTWSMSASF